MQIVVIQGYPLDLGGGIPRFNQQGRMIFAVFLCILMRLAK